jgi:hypothetical protein
MKGVIGIIGQGLVSGGASYAAGGNHDLRVGFGREEGKTLPLYKDGRVIGAIATAIVASTQSGAVADGAEEIARGLVSSVTSTEMIRRRAMDAAKTAGGEGITIELPAAAAANK